MNVSCGNCGTEIADVEPGTAVKCPECNAVIQTSSVQANMYSAYGKPEPSTQESVEAPPDGTRVMCPSCGKNLLGVWLDGALQIKHHGREWRVQGGIIGVKCHPQCGNILQIDTRIYQVNMVSSLDDLFAAEDTHIVDATLAAVELANELGIALSEVEGTSRDGRITKPDVQRHHDKTRAPSIS